MDTKELTDLFPGRLCLVTELSDVEQITAITERGGAAAAYGANGLAFIVEPFDNDTRFAWCDNCHRVTAHAEYTCTVCGTKNKEKQ